MHVVNSSLLLIASPRGQHGKEKTKEIGNPSGSPPFSSSTAGQDPPPQPRLLEKQRRLGEERRRRPTAQRREPAREGRWGGVHDAVARQRCRPAMLRPVRPTARSWLLPSSRARARCAGRASALGGAPPPRQLRTCAVVRQRRRWEGAGLRRGRGGEAVSGAGDDDAEAVAAQCGAMVMPTSDAATATVEDSPPAACGRRRRRGSEGSATHPRRALPPAEIDLPGGGATAAEAAAARLGSKT